MLTITFPDVNIDFILKVQPIISKYIMQNIYVTNSRTRMLADLNVAFYTNKQKKVNVYHVRELTMIKRNKRF